jgi:hypothetical protein
MLDESWVFNSYQRWCNCSGEELMVDKILAQYMYGSRHGEQPFVNRSFRLLPEVVNPILGTTPQHRTCGENAGRLLDFPPNNLSKLFELAEQRPRVM